MNSPVPACDCAPPPDGVVHIEDEADRLRACVMHPPGRELERLIPSNYRWYLFDDLIDLPEAREQHRRFAELLGCFGVRVYRFTRIVEEVYAHMSSHERERFLRDLGEPTGAPDYVINRLLEESPRTVARALIEGIAATDTFCSAVKESHYHFPPMANLMFMQDAAVVVRNRVVAGSMRDLVRLREEWLVAEVLRQHRLFGPLGSGDFWVDPGFRERHRMSRTIMPFLQLAAARVRLDVAAVERQRELGTASQWSADLDRVRVELDSVIMAEGRHYVVEGGNLLTLRAADGRSVVVAGHNARTSAEAIDELAHRLLRARADVAALVIIDHADAVEMDLHIDTKVLATGEGRIWVDHALLHRAGNVSFHVIRPRTVIDEESLPQPEDPDAEYRVRSTVYVTRAASLGAAFAEAGVNVELRAVPRRAPWVPVPDAEPRGSGSEGDAVPDQVIAHWFRVQQSISGSALNALVVAPGILVGFDRHRDFYRDHMDAECVSASDIVGGDGELSRLRCCRLVEALRRRGGGRVVAVLLSGDELVRARGGPRSLVLPLHRGSGDIAGGISR